MTVTKRRHTHDVTTFKVVAFRSQDPDQLSVWTLKTHTVVEHCVEITLVRLWTFTVQSPGVTIRNGRHMRIRIQEEPFSTAQLNRSRNVWITAAVRATVSLLTSTWLNNLRPAGHTSLRTPWTTVTSSHSREPPSTDSKRHAPPSRSQVRLLVKHITFYSFIIVSV